MQPNFVFFGRENTHPYPSTRTFGDSSPGLSKKPISVLRRFGTARKPDKRPGTLEWSGAKGSGVKAARSALSRCFRWLVIHGGVKSLRLSIRMIARSLQRDPLKARIASRPRDQEILIVLAQPMRTNPPSRENKAQAIERVNSRTPDHATRPFRS